MDVILSEERYLVEIHRSITEIDQNEWRQFIDVRHDLAMDPRLIRLTETSLADQAQFWTILLRGADRQVLACACLCLFHTDVMQSAPLWLRKIIQRLRNKLWPNFLKLKVLFCGLPLPAGKTHLRIHPQVNLPRVLALFNETMTKIARKEKAKLLVFKELSEEQDRQLGGLSALQFMRGELQPVYQLCQSFKSFAEYQQALRAPYRQQIRSNIKKFTAANLRVEHIFDPDEIHLRFDDKLHGLYLNVWGRVKEKLECFPVSFFRDLPKALPGQVVLTVIRDQEKPIAFALGLIAAHTYHNLYVGLDYAYLEPVDLYFNLFYQELDAIFRLHKTQILLGQTSGAFKARLGATPEPRFFWVRPLNPLLRYIFKTFRKFIFPHLNYPQANQVFKTLHSLPP